MGRLWAFSFLSYINDLNYSGDVSLSIYEQGGGTKRFSFATGSNTSAANTEDSSILQRTVNGTAETSYSRVFPDGSQQIYNVATSMASWAPRKVFLKQILDPQGNALTLSYDSQFRITGITDALGQVTTFSYGLPGDAYKITKVTDPFGRACSFAYSAAGQLASITDPVGIVSQFTYQGDFIQKLTTPYGDTAFTAGEMGSDITTWRWLEAVDPTGAKERVEYFQGDNPGIPVSDPAFPSGTQTVGSGLNIQNELLNTRNTFHWDKKAMIDAPGDYAAAHIYHWLHDPATQQITDVLESEKPRVVQLSGPKSRPTTRSAGALNRAGPAVTSMPREPCNWRRPATTRREIPHNPLIPWGEPPHTSTTPPVSICSRCETPPTDATTCWRY